MASHNPTDPQATPQPAQNDPQPAPANTPKAKAKDTPPAAPKPQKPGLDFASMYLETPDFEDRSQTYLPEIYQTARYTGEKVFMPADDVVKRTLRQRNPAIKDGEVDITLSNMKRQFERLENNRFNAFRTGWRGMPDTTYNNLQGYVTTKPGLDQRPTDPYAKSMGLKSRSVAQEFDLTPEQVVSQNMGRGETEQNDAGRLGVYQRTEHEYQQAKERFKQNKFTLVGKWNDKTGQVEPQKDENGRAILDEGPIDPTRYGYQATLDQTGMPVMMRVPKKDIKQFRGELLNVHDLVPSDSDMAVRKALFGSLTGDNWFGNTFGAAEVNAAKTNSRYNLNSSTMESVGRATYNYLQYTGKSASNIGAFVGGKFDKDYENKMLLQGSQTTAAMNADMRQGAFENVPSFMNSMSQLTNQLTVQQAFNFVLPGAGIAVTALDATANGYYEGIRNGLTETESNMFGVGMGALAWGFAKYLTGQTAAKLGILARKGAQNEINAIVRAEVGGLAKLVGKKAQDTGRQLSAAEVNEVMTQAKPWIVEKIGGRINALYDKAAGSTGGSALLGGVEEFADETFDTGSEDLTRKAMNYYLNGDLESRPEWVRESMENGTNTFAYKSVADIMSGAIEGGMLGAIGGTISRLPYAAALAKEHRDAKAFEKSIEGAQATEAFANYLVKNNFSKDAVNRVKKTLDDWKTEGRLGVWLDADGKVTDDENKTQNATMHRSLTDKVETLAQLAKQTNLLAWARGEGKSKLAEELSRAIGKDEDYLRTQQGMTQLLAVLDAKQQVSQATVDARQAIAKAIAPTSPNGDPAIDETVASGEDPAATSAMAAPDANGDGKSSPALSENASLFDSAAQGIADAATQTDLKKGKKGKKTGPAEAPDALGKETPTITEGQKIIEELAPKLGPAGTLITQWAENRRNQLKEQHKLLNTDGEDVEGRTLIRTNLAKLQEDEQKINDNINEAAAQTPAVGVLKELAAKQHALEQAATSQKQVFDGTLLAYQVQEGLLRLQTAYMQRQMDAPDTDPNTSSALRDGIDAMTKMATNPNTGQLDAAWVRQHLVDNEEYVARRRYAPLDQQEASRIRSAQVGAQAVQALTNALKAGDSTAIEAALTALEQAAPGKQQISVLDAAQATEASALLARTDKLDQRTDESQARPNLDPAQVPLNTQAPATPEQRAKVASKPAVPAVTPPTAEQVATQQAAVAAHVADTIDEAQAAVAEVEAVLAEPVTEETAADESQLVRVDSVLQKVLSYVIDFNNFLRGTWTPEMESAYRTILDALEDAHEMTHAAWHDQMVNARLTQNKKKIAKLKANEPAEFEATKEQTQQATTSARVAGSNQQAERIVQRLNARRSALRTALGKLTAALAQGSQALRKRGADLTNLAAAKAAVLAQRARYGARSLANQSAQLYYESLLPLLRPLVGLGRASMSALQTRLSALAGKMYSSRVPAETTTPTNPAKAPGIGGVTTEKSTDTYQDVNKLRQAISKWWANQNQQINTADQEQIKRIDAAIAAYEQAVAANAQNAAPQSIATEGFETARAAIMQGLADGTITLNQVWDFYDSLPAGAEFVMGEAGYQQTKVTFTRHTSQRTGNDIITITSWMTKDDGTTVVTDTNDVQRAADGTITTIGNASDAILEALRDEHGTNLAGERVVDKPVLVLPSIPAAAAPVVETTAHVQQMRELLSYFGRGVDDNASDEDVLAATHELSQEADEYGVSSTAKDDLKARVQTLLNRLGEPVDLLDVRGSDPDELAELDYLTGFAGVPGQLNRSLRFLEMLSKGEVDASDKTSTPESQKAAFAATPESAILKLRDAAQHNLGLALYRMRIVPLLNAQQALPKSSGGMGLKELDGMVAGLTVLQNQQMLQRADELLDARRQLGANRYMDDDKEQQLILASRHAILTNLLSLPTLAGVEHQAVRATVRDADQLMLTALSDGTATMAHLEAVEAPLRELLRLNPTFGLTLLEDMMADSLKAGRPLRETLSNLMAARDGEEASPVLVLTELMGPSRSVLTQHRLQRLHTTRGGQSATEPDATEDYQLSLEQEYTLQSVLGFLGTDQTPLAQLIAKYPDELSEKVHASTGLEIIATSSTMAVSGRPGTGKTFMSQEILAGAARLLGFSDQKPMPVLLSAPKPSQRNTLATMATDAGKSIVATMVEPAELLKKLLTGQSLGARVIVLDEGTALSVEMSRSLMSAVDKYNVGKPVGQQVRMIVLEDPLQLPGISEETNARSNAGHPFISQDIAMLRSRPLKQVYRSGYITLHNGLGKIGDRIFSGIDSVNMAQANDLSPVPGVRYAQPGAIETIEGWTYLGEEEQHKQIVDLVKALTRSNPDRKNVRVLVAPGQEKKELEKLVKAGLTENQAAGIIFSATDPRDQTVLNYDDAQGGQFEYVFIATEGEEFPANALRATYVGASRARQYASVRLLPGQQPQNEKETGSLAKYGKLEGETVKLRNKSVIAQLQEVASNGPAIVNTASTSSITDTTTDTTSNLVVNEDGNLAPAENEAEATAQAGDDSDAADTASQPTAQDAADNAATTQANTQTAPQGTAPSGTTGPISPDENDAATSTGSSATPGAAGTGPALSDEEAAALRAKTESLNTRMDAAFAETDNKDGSELTTKQELHQDLLQDPLSDYHIQHQQRLSILTMDLEEHASNPQTALAEGDAVVAELQASATEYDARARAMQRRTQQALAEGQAITPGYGIGQLPAIEGMPTGQQPGIVITMRENAQGQPVPVYAMAYVPTVDYETGKITGIREEPLEAKKLAGMNALEATRALRKFLQQQEYMLADVYYRLGRDIATIAAQKGRLIVHSHALPIAEGTDEPTVQQKQAKNGFLRKLFDIFTIGSRDLTASQPLTRDHLNGIASEQGPAFEGNGSFFLRYAPKYAHNFLDAPNDAPDMEDTVSQNRFVVEYVEKGRDGSIRTMTVGLVRYDQGAGEGRVRPADGTRPDTNLDNLLQYAFGKHATKPEGINIGESITVEGWRNARMFNKARFELPYSESYPIGDLFTQLTAENKSISSVFTITTPSTRDGVMLTANHQLVHGSSGRQVAFISHGLRSASEIDAIVAKAMKELPALVTKGLRTELSELNDRQLSDVLQGMLERYDLQMIYLGGANLTLDHYGKGLRTTMQESGGSKKAVTIPRPTAPEGLERLLGTTADQYGDISKRYPNAEHPVLPYSHTFRDPLFGSLFGGEQMRSTTRKGLTRKAVGNTVDEQRPGMLNTVRQALFNSGIFNEPENGAIVVTAEVAKLLSPAQVKHLQALAKQLNNPKSWPSKDSGRYSAAFLQDLFLYMDYLNGRGVPVQQAWDAWEAQHSDNRVQFNGHVLKADRLGGKSPLFTKTALPLGLGMADVFTTQYRASAEPSFQVNLAQTAARLIGGVSSNQVQIKPQPAATPAAPAAPAAAAPAAQAQAPQAASAESNDGPAVNTATMMVMPGGDEFADEFGAPNTAPNTASETPAAAPAPPPATAPDAPAGGKPARASRITPAAATLGTTNTVGTTGAAFNGSTLMAGVISDPESAFPATIHTDINWVLGEDYPRAERDAIIDASGLPADYMRVLGRYFRGLIELNRLPGNRLSRVAGRHEPLHAIMDLLTPEQRQRVLDAARQRIRAEQGASVDASMDDTAVEEYLADQFVKNWDVWRRGGEDYRNHPLVKQLNRTAFGKELLKFWEGLHNTYQRYLSRKDAVDRLFESAHRGYYIRSAEELSAHRERSTDPAKYATREKSNRRAAYEALRRRMGQDILMEVEKKIHTIMYGAYMYNYTPGELPFSVGEAVDTLKQELAAFVQAAIAGTADDNPDLIAEAGTKMGKLDFLNYNPGVRLAAMVNMLLTPADETLAPRQTWLDVLMKQNYAYAEMGENDANAEAEQESETATTGERAGEADTMTLGQDSAMLGASVEVHQRDSNLVNKEREAIETDRLQQQLETVPKIAYVNGKWVKTNNFDVFGTEQGGTNKLKQVLFSAYATAKKNTFTGGHPTRGDIARALLSLATPSGGNFGIAAASLLGRYFNQNNMLQVFDTEGNPLSELSFHEIAQSGEPEWAQYMDDALSELHSFYTSVEPRTMLDVDADSLIIGNVSNTLKNPITSSAKKRKNLSKSSMFLASFMRKGPEYVPNPVVLTELANAGFTLQATLDARGKPVVNVLHPSMEQPVLVLGRVQRSGSVRNRWAHGGGFQARETSPAYWQAATPLTQRLIGILGLTGIVDSDLIRNVMTQHTSEDGKHFTDPFNARTLLGKVLAQTLGMNITAHIAHSSRQADGAASKAGLEKLAGDSKGRLALTPVLHTDLKENLDKINDFLDRDARLGREVELLSPTVYWESAYDLGQTMEKLSPEKEQNTVRNDKNQKKSRNRNTTAVYPRLRTVEQVAKIPLDQPLPKELNHLNYLRNVAGGYVNLFASGLWKMKAVLESNVSESRSSGKRKLIVKGSSEELFQHAIWGGFLNQLVNMDGMGINVFNTPRSDKPTQKDFSVMSGDVSTIARVRQAADGRIIADDATRSVIAHQQMAVRSVMTYDSFNRITGALQTLLARPMAPGRTPAEQRPLTAEERTEIDGMVRNLFQLRGAANKASIASQSSTGFGYSMRDNEDVVAFNRLANGYSEVVNYLRAKDNGAGYWLTSMNMDANADYDKAAGTYPARIREVATKPRAQYIEDELQSLAAEVNDVMGAGMTFIPGKLADAAYAKLTGVKPDEANKELAPFRNAGKKANRVRYQVTEGEGEAKTTRDVYHPLLLSGLLSYRLVTGQTEQLLNGQHVYFKNHTDAVKRGMARETPIEIQDQEARRGLQNNIGVVGFEDTPLHTLHGDALTNRYNTTRRIGTNADGTPSYESKPLPTADQTARMQTPIFLGVLKLESQGIVVDKNTPMADILAAGMAQLAGTDAHDGISFMNMLQYRAESHGYGNKNRNEQAMQKNILTGQHFGGSVLAKTATMLFTNELLDLGNEYLYNQFVASMGGMTSLPMRAWIQARIALSKESAQQEDPAKWLNQQLRENRDWDMAEELLHTDPKYMGQDWRSSLAVSAMKSAVKTGPVGMAAGLDPNAHYQRVLMQLAESGRVLSMHSDLDGATVARITQEEHIPAGLGENFTTTQQVYGFLQELAKEGLLNLSDLETKSKAAAHAKGLSTAEAERAFFYDQLQQLMAGLDQRGTTLSSVERNHDPNLTLLQQHLQTAVAQAINTAVSKLRLPGVRSSVASLSGLVNMYEVTFRDSNGKEHTTRMTQQELLGLKTKQGKLLVARNRAVNGQMLFSNLFDVQPARTSSQQATLEQPYREGFTERPDHKEWYVEHHLHVMDRIADDLQKQHGGDRNLLHALVYAHDLAKAENNETRSHSDTIREALTKRNYNGNFIAKVIQYVELMDRVKTEDVADLPIEVRIASTADALSHYTNGENGFLNIFSTKTKPGIDPAELKASNDKKLAKDQRKILLPGYDLSQQQITYDAAGGTQVAGPVTNYVMGLAPASTGDIAASAARYSVKVDELRFLHVTNKQTGQPLSQEETLALYRTLRAAERGDVAARVRVETEWKLGQPDALYEIEPAEILMPRAILKPFFSPNELAGLTARQVQSFDARFFARRELKYLSFRKKLSKADQKLFDDLSTEFKDDRPGFKNALRQVAAARGVEIHRNLQVALTPKGTRIPVTNLNSMQLFKVAGFFDSHANTSIVPSELLTVSGADNDGDQLSHEFFDVNQRGLSDLSNGNRPSAEMDPAQLQLLLGVAPVETDEAPADEAGIALENQEVDNAEDAEQAVEAATPTEDVDISGENVDSSVGNVNSPEVADSGTPAEVDDQEEQQEDRSMSIRLRRSVQSIRRSLFNAKTQVLKNARNILDMMAPIDFDEFKPFSEEAERQAALFTQQRQGVERSQLKRSGHTGGAYELFRNLALHLANQAGKTGVGPFVKARELFDIYRMARSEGGNVQFRIPYAFMGRITNSLEDHSRQVMRQLEQMANAALDNAKWGFLGTLNVNEHTWGLYSSGMLGGMTFAELIPTINHQYMRDIVSYVTSKNTVRDEYTLSLVKALETDLLGRRRDKVQGEEDKPGVTKAAEMARGWYKEEKDADRGDKLFRLVSARQTQQAQQIQALLATGVAEDAAWMQVYGFTRVNLSRGEVTRADNTVELISLNKTHIGTEEENVRRYVVEQAYLLASRGREMREQISLLGVLGGVPTTDFDALRQAQSAARALGLDPEGDDLGKQLQRIGEGDFSIMDSNKKKKEEDPADKKGTMGLPTRLLLEKHPYLQTGLHGLGWDVQKRQSLLLRRHPVINRLMERALRSGYGRLGMEYDRYNYARNQLERLADVAFLQENQLTISDELIAANGAVATDLQLINRAATLGQHTMAGQEMTRRAIARILKTLSEQPEELTALGGAGRSMVIQTLQFSGDGRRIQPELRNGAELTPMQKMSLESAAEALPSLTNTSPEAGKLVQQLLLYYQLTSGGLKLGRGQLTEVLPASVLDAISAHRQQLVQSWREALLDVEAKEEDAYRQGQAERRAKAKAKGLEAKAVKIMKKDDAKGVNTPIAEAERQAMIAELLRNNSNAQVRLLAGLLDQYALPLARPEWLASMKFMVDDSNSAEGEMTLDTGKDGMHYARNAKLLPTIIDSVSMRAGLAGPWMRDETRKLPRYVQARTGGIAGHHVYAALPTRKGSPQSHIPVWVKQYPIAANDAISFGEDRPALSYFPVFDDTQVTDGLLEDVTQSPAWAKHKQSVEQTAKLLTKKLNEYYKKNKLTPETEAEVLKRLKHFLYGGQEVSMDEVVKCTIAPVA